MVNMIRITKENQIKILQLQCEKLLCIYSYIIERCQKGKLSKAEFLDAFQISEIVIEELETLEKSENNVILS